MAKYKIELTCYDHGKPEPYKDEVEGLFDTHEKAEIAMLTCAIEELDGLNDNTGDDFVPTDRVFRLHIDEEEADAIIRLWDSNGDYQPVTLYNIVEVDG